MPAYNELQLSSFMDQTFQRLRAMERQLALLSEKAGVPYEAPFAEAPPEVLELVEAGDRIGAITKFRELTGADLDTAKEAVAKL
jgi:ribosomal protein L7/L12